MVLESRFGMLGKYLQKMPHRKDEALGLKKLTGYFLVLLIALFIAALITFLSASERLGLPRLSFATSRNICVLACGISSIFSDFVLLLSVSLLLKRKVKLNKIILGAFFGGISILFLFIIYFLQRS